MTTDREHPYGLTIRQLLERIEYETGGFVTDLTPTMVVRINEWARTAITICDRLTSNESAWIDKYHQGKEMGFSDSEAEAAADREVSRGA